MALDISQIAESINNFLMTYLSDVVVLVVIFLSGIIIAKIAGKAMKHLLNEFEVNAIVKKVSGKKIAASKIAETSIRYFLYFVTFIIILDQLGITTTFFEIVAGGLVLLLGLGLLLGFRDFIPNFFASFAVKKTIPEGSVLEYRKARGKVIKFGITYLIIEDKHKQMIYIPYSDLKQEMYRIHPPKRSLFKKEN